MDILSLIDNMAQSEGQEVSFDQVIKLARKGSSVKELMEDCSLLRGSGGVDCYEASVGA